jgi:ABC-type sugar transport system substrate-binding protein
MNRRSARAGCIALLATGALILAACGGSSSSSTSSSQSSTGADSSLLTNGGGRLIVMFTFPSTNTYDAALYKGAQAEAAKLNYKLKVIQNDGTDQSSEDAQVVQYLAAGQKPAMYAWVPIDQNAGLATLAKLTASGVPVMQENVQAIPQTYSYFKFYAGTNFTQNGANSGQAILSAVQALKVSGAKLHSSNGNLVVLSWPQSLSTAALKFAGVMSTLKSSANPPDLIDTIYATTFDNPGGYAAMSTAISRDGSKGIDVVYAMNDAMADGAIRALQAAGYHPGKNVMVVGANCYGDSSPLVAGTQYSSVLVAGQLEGQFFIQMVARYFASGGKVDSGSYTAPATADSAPNLPSTVHKFNYLPQPVVIIGKGSAAKNQAALNSAKLWGDSFTKLCVY